MIKSLLVLFNLLGLFLCRLFFPVTVNVSQTVPFSSTIGNSFIIQVAINKGDLKGIAKFTEQLPKGFTATPIDNQGAKTMFENNTIQYSWDSLPSDNILNISFRVDVGSTASTVRDTMIGKFFYIMDSQKLESDCLPSFINITGTSVVASSGSHEVDSIKNCPGGVFGIRRFPSPAIPPNSDAKITIIIHKPNITGFAKIEDSLPPGFTAAAVDVSGASFTFVDNIAKFVWQNIPSDSVITISYSLLAGSSVSGTHAVSGNFSYIFNSAPISCSIGTTIFNTTVLPSNNALAANNVTPGSGISPSPRYPNSTNQLQPQVAAGDTTKPVATSNSANSANVSNNSNQSNNSNTNKSNVQPDNGSNVTPSITSAQTGINYRVQIMALHNPVDVSYFSLKRKINTNVKTELIGGFTKYTVGNYDDYKTVRDERETYRNRGIVGPFVVSYNSGVRITVQEALMISHQKWYQ